MKNIDQIADKDNRQNILLKGELEALKLQLDSTSVLLDAVTNQMEVMRQLKNGHEEHIELLKARIAILEGKEKEVEDLKTVAAQAQAELAYYRSRMAVLKKDPIALGLLGAMSIKDRIVGDKAPVKAEECTVDSCGGLRYPVLEVPSFETVKVSVIIPVYNQFDYTYHCIESILKNTGDVTYEIIIADDCSTDETTQLEQYIQNVTHIKTAENVRFLLNCNHAAQHARGEYIFFLNNDTQVQENWLSSLVELMEQDATIGMAGSKLIYPNGKLQEAGGIVWKDGSAWNYGNGDDPSKPQYCYVRDVDYISGAAILIRRTLWEQIGGFDTRYVPNYYEDTDLAFEVRRAGYRVVFQPLSRVAHFEGVSNGTDVSSGLKQYQVTNAQKFLEKWKSVLETENHPNGENLFLAKDRSKGKKHILVIDHHMPFYDRDAGGRCTYMYLELFVKMGMQVSFLSDYFKREEPYSTKLEQMGIELLIEEYYFNHWRDWLRDQLQYYDYVYLQRPHISVKYIDFIRKYFSGKILYFAHDLHHIREMREYEITGDEEHRISAERWKGIEYYLFSKADVGHVVGSFEQKILQEIFPEKIIRNIPLYMYENIPCCPEIGQPGIGQFEIDQLGGGQSVSAGSESELQSVVMEQLVHGFESRRDIMYVGGFGHHPNVDAVLWFAKEVFPKILEKKPEIKWHVIGGKAPAEVLSLAGENIILEGFVSDERLRELYESSAIAVVPLRYGAGVKGKVVEACYYQTPLVTTSIGAEGLDIDKKPFAVVDDATLMAEKISELYENPKLLAEMAAREATFIKENFLISHAEEVLRRDIEV